MRVWVIIPKFEVFVPEAVYFPDFRIDPHPGERTWLSRELLSGLVKMVEVKMRVTDGMDEFSGLRSADLGCHHKKEGIGGDIEGNSQKKVRTALVQLKRQSGTPAFFPGRYHAELEEGVAGRQSHVIHQGDIPGTDNVAP